MIRRWGRRLQCAAACVAVAGYAGLSHYCTASPGASGLGAALALSPPLALVAVLAWRELPPALAAPCIAGLAALLYAVWPTLERNFPWIYLAQEGGLYGLLGVTFGRTLLPNRVPLCSVLADKVHGPLSEPERRYTRRVTAAWSILFFGIAAASLLLFALAPLRVWSIYSNFCVLPVVAAMFVGEYLIRRRMLPQGRRAGLADTLRVYFASPQKS